MWTSFVLCGTCVMNIKHDGKPQPDRFNIYVWPFYSCNSNQQRQHARDGIFCVPSPSRRCSPLSDIHCPEHTLHRVSCQPNADDKLIFYSVTMSPMPSIGSRFHIVAVVSVFDMRWKRSCCSMMMMMRDIGRWRNSILNTDEHFKRENIFFSVRYSSFEQSIQLVIGHDCAILLSFESHQISLSRVHIILLPLAAN